MLLPEVPAGLYHAVVIPPSIETEHKSTEPTIASESELATAVSSKDPVAPKRRQGKQLPMQSAKSNKHTSTSLSVPKPATNLNQKNLLLKMKMKTFMKQLVLIPIILNKVPLMKCMQSCPVPNLSMIGIKILM